MCGQRVDCNGWQRHQGSHKCWMGEQKRKKQRKCKATGCSTFAYCFLYITRSSKPCNPQLAGTMALGPQASCSYRSTAGSPHTFSVLRPSQSTRHSIGARSASGLWPRDASCKLWPGELKQLQPRLSVRARVFNNNPGGGRNEDIGDRFVACLPYLLPLLDALPFGELDEGTVAARQCHLR